MASELLFAAPGELDQQPMPTVAASDFKVPPLNIGGNLGGSADLDAPASASPSVSNAHLDSAGTQRMSASGTASAPHKPLPTATVPDPGLPGERPAPMSPGGTRRVLIPSIAGAKAASGAPGGSTIRVAPLTARPHHVSPMAGSLPADTPASARLPGSANDALLLPPPAAGLSGSRGGATSPSAKAAGKKAKASRDRVAQLKVMSQELNAAEGGRGQLMRTVQSTIQQRQRQRFASQMHLLRLQLNMKLPAPTNTEGENGAQAILEKYGRNRGGARLDDASSSDDGDGEAERLNAHIPNPTLAADVKRRLLEEVVPSQYRVRLFHKCALTGRPPPSVEEALQRRTMPRIGACADTPNQAGRPSGDASSNASVASSSMRRGGEPNSARTAQTRPSFKAVADANRPTPPPQPLVPKPPSRAELIEGGPGSPGPQHQPLSRRSSRRSNASNASNAAFMTEADELAAHRRSLDLDDAALRQKQLRETKREPADFAKLKSQDRHAQQFRRTHWERHVQEAKQKRASRKSAHSGNKSGVFGSVSATVGDGAASPAGDDESPSSSRKRDPLTDRPAQHTVDSVDQFLAALCHETERFNKQQLEELQRARTAQGTFHATKVATFEDIMASGELRNAPAHKVFLSLRARVSGAARAKDQAERLDVFYQHIDRVRACVPLLFRTEAEQTIAHRYLDVLRERVTACDGQQNAGDFEHCVFAVYPTERLLQDAVVSLLELASPMFNITETAFAAWLQAKLQCFSDRDREYQTQFRMVEQQFGRDAATEAKFKLTVHTVRGFSHFAQLRPQLSVRVVAERKTVHTQPLQGVKPLWHEPFVLHLLNDSNPVKLYVLMNDGEVIGTGTLSVSKAPIGKAVKQWVSVQGTQANSGEMQVTLEVYPPVMFQRPA